jgi:hypothetical protein
MKTIEEVYDDYLYDCHIANKRLTPEEWQYYGREEHHIEIPDRDGGLLSPLNKQPLTTYQHWVAGVLQSEVLQKKCFFAIPNGALPKCLDSIKKKWIANHNSESGAIGGRITGRKNVESGHMQRIQSLGGQVGYQRGLAKMSEEEKREASHKSKLAIARRIILITPDGDELEYTAIADAAKEHNLSSAHLTAVCKGRRKHHKGFTARYAD